MSLSLTVGDHGYIARATPTVLANVLFSGSLETPAWNWTSAELRGHLKNTLVYLPQDPDHTFNNSGDPLAKVCAVDYPGWTDCPVIWDAGAALNNQMQHSGRTIYIPSVTPHAVDSEALVLGDGVTLAVGDGVGGVGTTTFSGRLAHYPVLATTVTINGGSENFTDKHTDELDGSLGGSGTINRFTGEYEITFSSPPNSGQPITATYSYFTYNTGGTLRKFIQGHDPAAEGYVSAAELGLDNSTVVPSGYVYDFNTDNAFSTADADWLINWTRGYSDGQANGDVKEWILGALDHSVPAVATPPASSPWYYGTAFPEDKPDSDQRPHRLSGVHRHPRRPPSGGLCRCARRHAACL